MSGGPRWSELRAQARQARHNARSEMARAVRLMEEAVSEARAALADGDPAGELANLLNSLGGLYREVGRLDDAIATGREGLALRRTVAPRSSALIGNDVMFLALALGSRGAIDEALALAEEGLALYEETYGPAHGEVRYVRGVVDQLRARQRSGARSIVEP